MICAVVRRSLTPRPRETANPASATISSSLPNSDGWNWKNGSGIQRVAPLRRRHPVDDDVERDEQPEGDVAVLPQARVVEPRRRSSASDQPERGEGRLVREVVMAGVRRAA